MAGLYLDDQLVYRIDVDVREAFETDAHTESSEHGHCFIEIQEPSFPKEAECSMGAVVEPAQISFNEEHASASFVFDDAREELFRELFAEIIFGAAEGCLIADLVEVGHRLGALAAVSANGHGGVAAGFGNTLQFLGDSKSGKMQHDAEPRAGSEIGGAGGEVSPAMVERQRDLLFKAIVECVDIGVNGAKIESWADALNAKVIFFVDHDASCQFASDGDCCGKGGGCQLRGNQMPLDHHESGWIVLRGQIDPLERIHRGLSVADWFDEIQNLVAYAFGGAIDERKALDIASQSCSAGEHDISECGGSAVVWAVAIGIDSHESSSSSRTRRNSSRSSAARS